MKRIAFPIIVSMTFLGTPGLAQSVSIDGLVSGCWLEPDNCVSLVEGFVSSLDPNDEHSQVVIGLLAAKLYDVGQDAQIENRGGFFAAMLRIAAWLDGIGASQSAGVEELAYDLVGGDGNNGNLPGGDDAPGGDTPGNDTPGGDGSEGDQPDRPDDLPGDEPDQPGDLPDDEPDQPDDLPDDEPDDEPDDASDE